MSSAGSRLRLNFRHPRQHRDGELLRIGRREQELHVGRRLLERLQQCVEALLREHVHLVDEVHLVAAAGGRELDVVHQLARLVDLRARRRVHLDEIDESPVVDLHAGAALAARLRGDARFAVDALGENAREGRLSDPSGAGEEEGVMQPVRVQRIDQRARDMGLPDELLEVARTPLSGQHLVAHWVLHSVAGRGGCGFAFDRVRKRR